MSQIANSIAGLLTRQQVAYQLLAYADGESLQQAANWLHIPEQNIIRAVVLRDRQGLFLAVLPLNHLLDFVALQALRKGPVETVSASIVGEYFSDCDSGSVPPIGSLYQMETLCDNSLLDRQEIVFEAGRHRSLVRVSGEDFIRLLQGAHFAQFAQPEETLQQSRGGSMSGSGTASSKTVQDEAFLPPPAVASRLSQAYVLPPLPQHVQKILAIRDDPKATVEQLVEIVERDPSLAAQVLRYARSPFFGSHSDVSSIEDAITRVLGFDMVLNLALGLAALQSFQIPPDGPLGLRSLLRHATLVGEMARRLCRKCKALAGKNPGQVYLAGLLHDFGFLVVGHLFQPEYFLLNKMANANPQLCILEVERHVLAHGHAREVFAMGHTAVGAWLLQYWHLPQEFAMVCKQHHNPDYQGPHHAMAHLILVVDRLLKSHGHGDACANDIPDAVLQRLGLERSDLEAFVADQAEWLQGLENQKDLYF